MDHHQQRREDLRKIVQSEHPRRVVVAGPGTGKSFLFEQAIAAERKKGKSSFLALTFVGKLGDALADDLAGLAETATLHGFARGFVLDLCPKGWTYHPRMSSVIEEDLKVRGVKSYVIGDRAYEERTKHYRTIGNDDVVAYAVKACKKDSSKIPSYDLILVDEFQDFNATEAEFIDVLATKNKVLIVGDDDQALYEFKGSSPQYIRNKFDPANGEDFERHTLRFCSRCTDVIVGAFHDIAGHFGLNNKDSKRIKKDYVCYLPAEGGKKEDSDLNPKICLALETAPGQVPHLIRFKLEGLLEHQKIKTVLVIGEGRTCKKTLESIAKKLRDFGFKCVDHRDSESKPFRFKQDVINAYRILAKGDNDLLAWRLLAMLMPESMRRKLLEKHYLDGPAFVADIPKKFRDLHAANAEVLEKILSKPESQRKQIGLSSINKLAAELTEEKAEERELLIGQLVYENKTLPRPLNALDITVANILGSKGLGADVVFLIGFDEGKLPFKAKPEDAEVYQMLVALTRAKKRIYLINTIGSKVSTFLQCIKQDRIEKL